MDRAVPAINSSIRDGEKGGARVTQGEDEEGWNCIEGADWPFAKRRRKFQRRETTFRRYHKALFWGVESSLPTGREVREKKREIEVE